MPPTQSGVREGTSPFLVAMVVGLASFGFARPVASILLSHGTTVAAALLNTSAAGRRISRNPLSTHGS